MDDIFAFSATKITSDCSNLCLGWVSRTDDFAACGDDKVALKNHLAYWAFQHISHDSWEEIFPLVLFVVAFHLFLSCLYKLKANQFEALPLEPRNNLANNPALNSVRLYHDKRTFLTHRFNYNGT